MFDGILEGVERMNGVGRDLVGQLVHPAPAPAPYTRKKTFCIRMDAFAKPDRSKKKGG